MPRLLLAFAFAAALSPMVSAQTPGGSLTGTISQPSGALVPDAPIQLTNKNTGVIARTASQSDGAYSLAGLAPGTYEFTIVMPCCAYQQVKQEVAIAAGQNARLNIHLLETLNGTTLGDDPGRLAALLRKRAHLAAQPAPHTAQGTPDLSGVWVVTDDPYPESPQPLPWAAALIAQRRANFGKDAPHNHCLPGPPPTPGSTAPFMAKFVQTASLVVILFEDSPGFRQVFLDGRAHPANWDPNWMGHSVGQWDGDALFVDTIGFNDRSWLGGVGGGLFPHSEMLHITERYQRVDFAHMDGVVTFEDPGAYRQPFHMNLKFDLAPREEVMEYVCENNHPEHLVGK